MRFLTESKDDTADQDEVEHGDSRADAIKVDTVRSYFKKRVHVLGREKIGRQRTHEDEQHEDG